MKKDFFKDKVAIITGSRQGIGKKLASTLAELGAHVVLNSRNLGGLQKTTMELQERGLSVYAIQGDVAVPEDCERLVSETVDKFGKIDILVNNAGLSGKGKLEDSAPVTYEKIVNVNVLGSIFPAKYVLPYVKKTGGSIIFIGSLAGINGLPFYSAYSASKMAITALAESLKIELYKQNVHIGVSYVSFTENDPEKKVYKANGELENLPKRTNVKVMPVEKTVDIILRQIQKRKFKVIHSTLGKINWYMYRFFPGLISFILARSLKKFQD